MTTDISETGLESLIVRYMIGPVGLEVGSLGAADGIELSSQFG
jgi:hypothetical protein